MTLATPGAERSDEEAVAEEVMGARRQVKIFIDENGPWSLDTSINQWLASKPGIEILEFFPVSVSTSVSTVAALAATTVNMSTANAGMTERYADEKKTTVAAVGIYYTER